MTSDRFHRAARDGYIEYLKEATRKDCNARDDDGMTPTLWAAFEGNLEALRLLVGRGGDPDKCDNYGNTALHFAAAKGNMHCVTFLVNFGANLWALDIDFHTPKELAAMNDRDEILRYLDDVITKQETMNKKQVKLLKEKALKEAEKRAKNFQKVQEKAEKMAAREQKRLAKEREKMVSTNEDEAMNGHRNSLSLAALNLRRDSRLVYVQSPKYSDIVNAGNETKQKGPTGAVYKKVQQQRKTRATEGSIKSSSTVTVSSDFKVGTGATEKDGKRSIRSLSGLRRDSEVMYVPKYESNVPGKRGKLAGVFDDGEESNLSRSISQPDYLNKADSGFGDDLAIQGVGSIFDRPGFGSVAFRNSLTATLSALPRRDKYHDISQNSDRGSSNQRSGTEDSIGSAGSLAKRNTPWDDQDLDSDEDDEDGQNSPLHFFLAAAGLTEFIPYFIREKIDLDALMLLVDDDLKAMHLPLGPRKKLLKAIEDRKQALDDPGELIDSRL